MLKLALFILSFAAYAAETPNYPVTVIGGDEASFYPKLDEKNAVSSEKKYDVIVVGAGLAGLSSALYLSDHGKTVLVLEKEATLGGLASGSEFSASKYDRGAAYWTSAYEEETQILKHIGLGKYLKKYPIAEPIDSYFWKGELFEGIWDAATLERLPASFSLYKYELQKANDDGLIPNQPIEEFENLTLDKTSASDWIRSMPQKTAQRTDDKSKEIYARYSKELAEGKISASDPMGDVVALMDLYCRSALGNTSSHISAVAFANFYISEVETRYTTQIGTGQAAVNMEAKLRKRKNVELVTSAPVGKIEESGSALNVYYIHNGATHRATSDYAVFAAQLKLAPKIITGLAEKAPEKTDLISKLDYSHYSVHGVRLKGHPYRVTYDTWTRANDYTDDDFTDFILGRWMDPKINGYQGMRDFKKNPKDDVGIFTIYHPLTQKWIGSGYTAEQATELARTAAARLIELYQPLLTKNWGTKIEIESIQTNRWPFSVHVPEPGHFLKKAKILRKPVGRIFFANNNLGTPAFEEALFRGHCAADNILARMDASFSFEKWSRCPREQQ